MPERDVLRRLASRLAGDRPIDWDAEERAALTDEERGAIEQLRMVAAMAGFHRGVQAGDTSVDLSVSISLARSVADSRGGSASMSEHGDRVGESMPQVAPAWPSVAGLPAGFRWGHLEILGLVGRGAFGAVYRARDTRLDRIVALKLLEHEMPGPPEEVVREARLLARIHHPNVVTVYGADRIDDQVGIWMEFVQGETLQQIIRTRGTLDAREAALIGIDLCRALSAVHAAGMTHRDIKLGNVMRAEGGRIVLMDFGLGREVEPAPPRHGSRKLSGTPLFMAPEVLRGSHADVRSDVYSLGVVLFSLVTGSLPVEAKSLSELRGKHKRGEVRHARDLRPDLPEAFAHVLDRALPSDPRHRFRTAGEAERALLQSLGAVVHSESGTSPASWRGSRLVTWFVLAGALVAASALGWRWLSTRTGSDAEIAAPPFSEEPTLVLLGERAEDMFGLAVAGVGDVDQDGFGDVLVGAPHSDAGALDSGRIYLYRGRSEGLDPHPTWTATDGAVNACLGWSIASTTNLSFDGFADLVVGAPGYDGDTTPMVGRVLVYPGSPSGPSSSPFQTLSASEPGTRFGFAIATGDVDHDGNDDLLVGEPAYRSGSGRALLYRATGGAYAKTPAWIAEGPPNSRFGMSLDLRGDVNNDGFRDAVVGAVTASFGPEASEAGAAYVYLGSAAGLDSIPTVLPGRQTGALFGQGVLFPGDLNVDGYGDLIVGAESASNGEQDEGVAEIYFGSGSGIAPYGAVVLESNNLGANFGGHLGRVGDVDGDGCDDLLAGAVRFQQTNPREGAVFLFRGSPRREIRSLWFRVGGKSGSWYGSALSSGDFNNDGRPDVVVSACAWDTDEGPNVGRVDVFLNRRGEQKESAP